MSRYKFPRWVIGLWLALLVLSSCSAPLPVGTTPPTPTVAPPTVTPTATVPSTSTPTAPTTATGFPASAYGSIAIVGNSKFIHQTQVALLLLQTKAPDAYQKVVAYVGIIEQFDRSGMWAYEDPPRYSVSDLTAFYSVTWYASTIAHDATHSELYHQYLALKGAPVPDSIWIGEEVERFCNSYQLDVLKRIGGTPDEVDYLASLTGTHCDVDGDGDCDWDDYNGRHW